MAVGTNFAGRWRPAGQARRLSYPKCAQWTGEAPVLPEPVRHFLDCNEAQTTSPSLRAKIWPLAKAGGA